MLASLDCTALQCMACGPFPRQIQRVWSLPDPICVHFMVLLVWGNPEELDVR